MLLVRDCLFVVLKYACFAAGLHQEIVFLTAWDAGGSRQLCSAKRATGSTVLWPTSALSKPLISPIALANVTNSIMPGQLVPGGHLAFIGEPACIRSFVV